MERELIEMIVSKVLAKLTARLQFPPHPQAVPVGVSNRHIHLSEEHLEVLFGKGYMLQKQRELSQTGQYAAVETVVLAGPRGCLENVRVLGPVRRQTQVEVSIGDAFKLGVKPPVRESGKLAGSGGITVIGPKGTVTLLEGLIIAQRHIHMKPEDAAFFGVSDGDVVQVRAEGDRGIVFDQVVVRVDVKFVLEFHIDLDEANACGIKQGSEVNIIIGASTVKQDLKQDFKQSEQCEILTLVTEAEVRKAWKSNSTVYAGKEALVTPLARDAIKELKVELIIAN